MEKKNNFFVGIVLSSLIFLALYSLICLILGVPFFVKDSETLWSYIVSFMPNLILSRLMLVNWDMDRTGKGMMFITLLGILIVMFIMLR